MRRIFIVMILSAFAGCFMAGPAGAAKSSDKPRNVILIGWDGAQRNHVKEMLGKNELPNLKKLASEGALVAIDIYRTTDTKAGWAQILTGYEPEVTGVFSNGIFQSIPEGYTIFERLEKHFGPDNFVTVAVIGKKGNVGNAAAKKQRIKNQPAARQKKKAEIGRIVEEDGLKYRVVAAEPYYNASKNMDVFINGLGKDVNVGTKAIELLEKYKSKPFFFFVHFADVDHQGHKFGENSKEYDEALKSGDFWTGKIVESHRDAPYVFLGTNDKKVIRRGTRTDITPTILDRYGVDLDKIQPKLDGYPLTKQYQQKIW
jgi:predicted AlkP superfamily pyrophosphatase or phosphodiesterase